MVDRKTSPNTFNSPNTSQKLVLHQSKYITETSSSSVQIHQHHRNQLFISPNTSQKLVLHQSKYITETSSSSVQIHHRNQFFISPNTSQKLVLHQSKYITDIDTLILSPIPVVYIPCVKDIPIKTEIIDQNFQENGYIYRYNLSS